MQGYTNSEWDILWTAEKRLAFARLGVIKKSVSSLPTWKTCSQIESSKHRRLTVGPASHSIAGRPGLRACAAGRSSGHSIPSKQQGTWVGVQWFANHDSPGGLRRCDGPERGHGLRPKRALELSQWNIHRTLVPPASSLGLGVRRAYGRADTSTVRESKSMQLAQSLVTFTWTLSQPGLSRGDWVWGTVKFGPGGPAPWQALNPSREHRDRNKATTKLLTVFGIIRRDPETVLAPPTTTRIPGRILRIGTEATCLFDLLWHVHPQSRRPRRPHLMISHTCVLTPMFSRFNFII